MGNMLLIFGIALLVFGVVLVLFDAFGAGVLFAVFGLISISLWFTYEFEKDPSSSFTQGDMYALYYAYEDGELDKDEIRLLNRFKDGPKFVEALDGLDVKRTTLLDYEEFVGDVLDELDESEGHVDFKSYVVLADQERIAGVLEDGKVDAREREVLTFMGDVLDKDVSVMIEELETDEVKGLARLNELVRDFRSEYVKFDVEEVKGFQVAE